MALWDGLFIPLAILTTLGFILRWLALPRPIPGIPYNRESKNRILGDVPWILSLPSRRDWQNRLLQKHNAPMVQAFFKPFTKPIVILGDFREAMDICLRRTKEFDRDGLNHALFVGIAPSHHITMKSAESGYKKSKAAIKDLMTPEFLNRVSTDPSLVAGSSFTDVFISQTAAPEIYSKAQMLVELWDKKTRISQGRPFEAGTDLYNYAMDIITAVAFGIDRSRSMLYMNIDYLATNYDSKCDPSTETKVYEFPELPLTKELAALITITQSVGIAGRALIPTLRHWIYRQTSEWKEAYTAKEALISNQINSSVECLNTKRMAEDDTKSAVDQMIFREAQEAAKEGRSPDFHSRTIYDEVCNFPNYVPPKQFI
jgi:hypothetical protein